MLQARMKLLQTMWRTLGSMFRILRAGKRCKPVYFLIACPVGAINMQSSVRLP